MGRIQHHLLRAAAILCAIAGGCAKSPDTLTTTALQSGRNQIYRISEQGVALLGLTAHPLTEETPPCGVHRAVARASREAPCSAAVFDYDHRQKALQWLRHECVRRRAAGRPVRVVLAGHSWGATAAGEIGKQLLAEQPDLVMQLLVTVDAIKSGALGATTGITTTILTLNNPIPGKKMYFVAYDGTPPVDGKRVLAHANYYQNTTPLYHGRPIATASENHRITGKTAKAVNHGNVDDYAFPLVLADLCHAVRKGMQQ